MPVLREAAAPLPALRERPKSSGTGDTGRTEPARGGTGLLSCCANPKCRSGWLQVLRSRSSPLIEGGWTCSPACTEQRLAALMMREEGGRGATAGRHRHRVPLGLLMLEQNWITGAQLRRALEAQRANGAGRLGQWLVAREGVSELLVTRALGLQWSCPVLPLKAHDPEGLSPALPRLFVDAFGALPLRVGAGRLLYLGFEDGPDPALALALERISGLRVECGLVAGSDFRHAHARMLAARFPVLELIEAASEPALLRALSRAVEKARPVEARLARVHDFLWLRMWRRTQAGPVPEASAVQDLVGTVTG